MVGRPVCKARDRERLWAGSLIKGATGVLSGGGHKVTKRRGGLWESRQRGGEGRTPWPPPVALGLIPTTCRPLPERPEEIGGRDISASGQPIAGASRRRRQGRRDDAVLDALLGSPPKPTQAIAGCPGVAVLLCCRRSRRCHRDMTINAQFGKRDDFSGATNRQKRVVRRLGRPPPLGKRLGRVIGASRPFSSPKSCSATWPPVRRAAPARRSHGRPGRPQGRARESCSCRRAPATPVLCLRAHLTQAGPRAALTLVRRTIGWAR